MIENGLADHEKMYALCKTDAFANRTWSDESTRCIYTSCVWALHVSHIWRCLKQICGRFSSIYLAFPDAVDNYSQYLWHKNPIRVIKMDFRMLHFKIGSLCGLCTAHWRSDTYHDVISTSMHATMHACPMCLARILPFRSEVHVRGVCIMYGCACCRSTRLCSGGHSPNWITTEYNSSDVPRAAIWQTPRGTNNQCRYIARF